MTLRQRKKGRRIYWQVDLGLVSGRRVQKNFRRQSAARTFLAAARKEEALHGRRAFELSQEDRVAFLRARQKLSDAGASIDQAVEFFLERRPRGELTLSQAINECVVAKSAGGRRPRYLQQFEGVLRSFEAGRGETLVSRLEAGQIEAWLNGNGWQPATRRSYLIDLRTLFSWCVRRGVLIENPAERVERVLLEEKPPGILTVDQCRRLLEAAKAENRKQKAEMIPYIALGLFCGIRPEEISRLTWADVDLKRGLVEVAGPRAKSRRRRLVTIPRNARDWLMVDGLRVDRKAKGPICQPNFRRRWNELREAAGFSLSTINHQPSTSAEWPHDALRHSFASYHLAAHQSQDKTAHELGHGSTAMLFAHYRELVTPAAARQFWAITPASIKAENGKQKADEAKIIPMRAGAG
jgi:integrase